MRIPNASRTSSSRRMTSSIGANVQSKYELVRRLKRDGSSVSEAAKAFGLFPL